MNTRRQFLQVTAGLAAVSAAASGAAGPAALPAVRVGKGEGTRLVSRMILGSNPFYGYSHASRTLDQHMREWGTPGNVCAALAEAERNGITTFQTNGNDRAITDIAMHRE